MARKKKPIKNPTAADLPQNPEFQVFAEFARQIVSVPKADIDRMIAEEKQAKEPNDPDDCEPMSV